jgi:hypothetical protein
VRKWILCLLFLGAASALLPAAGNRPDPAPPWIEIEPWNVGPDPADPFCSPYLCLQVAAGAQCETNPEGKDHMIEVSAWDQNKQSWVTPDRYSYAGVKQETSNFYFGGKDVVSAGTWRVYIHKDSQWGKDILAGNTGVYVYVELYEHSSDTFPAAWDSMTGIWPQGGCTPAGAPAAAETPTPPRGWRTLFSGPRRAAPSR